ncbi:flippase-like domain-containing protein [bacterium]|nr:flippase-like domain-containing protein [bacterium]
MTQDTTSSEQVLHKKHAGRDFRSPSWQWMTTLLFGLIIIVVLLALSDISKFVAILYHVDLSMLSRAFIATCVSYYFITASYKVLLSMVKYNLRFGELFMITVLSTLVNYFIAIGGISGYALRALLLKKRDIPPVTTFSVSLIQGVLTNITMVLLFVFSCLALLMHETLTAFQLYIMVAPIIFAVFFIVFILVLIFDEVSTNRVLEAMENVTRYAERLFQKESGRWGSVVQRITVQTNQALQLFRPQKKQMIIPAIQICGDWICAMICLYYCFYAINHPMPWLIIAGVYFIGIFLSYAFIAVGGLGVMEGGMTAVFYEFGVPWESALAAVLLYRFTYYLIPLLTALPFYIRFVFRTPVKL